MSCGCFEGLQQRLQRVWGAFQAPGNYGEEREAFERTVDFLLSVPLLKKQLPKAELPKVAQQLTRRVWQPGQILVRQGEMGRALFLIESGEAEVVTCQKPGAPEVVRATLVAGDYFGGHTLITERANVATIVASRKSNLVTLSLSRDRFETLGLRRWLQFPKRPAIYNSPQETGKADISDIPKLPPDDLLFVCKAISENANLRALLAASEDKLKELAAGAVAKSFKKGDRIVEAGQHVRQLYIVKTGIISVVVDTSATPGGRQSAEAAVASSTMTERLLRKQNFLAQLQRKETSMVTASLFVGAAQNQKADLHPGGRAQPRQGAAARQIRRLSGIAGGGVPSQPQQNDEHKERGNADTETSLAAGDSFGELSILYKMPMHAEFSAKEDCTMYVIDRQHFTACFNRRGKRFDEFLSLLEEVQILSPLLASERFELACNAIGLVEFQPGERVLHQGLMRSAKLWYVIHAGTGVVSLDQEKNGKKENEFLTNLSRAAHFGERSLLRGDAAAPVNIDAGPDGMVCLTFWGDTICVLLRKVLEQENSVAPSPFSDLKEWWVRKARGFKSRDDGVNRVMISWDRMQSNCQVELDELTKVCVLGKGAYGQVCLVEDAMRGQRYALKALSKGHVANQGTQRLVNGEREMLSMIDSSFVIRLHRTYKDAQHVYFLLEAALGGSLVQVVKDHPEIFVQDAPRGHSGAFYAACVIAALEHLHERRIVHRDIKPENALLDEHGYAKVCDMGFARFVLSKTNTLVGTPDYMAPEVIDFPHTHNSSVDWWALGVLTYEILSGHTPFTDEGVSDPMERLLAIRRSQEQGPLQYPFHFPQVAKGFVAQLLQIRPHERLGAGRGGAQDVRDHAMFRTLAFDFKAFHEQKLPTPFHKQWSYPEHFFTDDFGLDRGQLGLDTSDSLFIPYNADPADDWDAKF